MSATRSTVFKAADQLAAEGRIPTFTSVREKLGGGSYSTIGKYLKEWKDTPGRGHPPLPDALRSALLRFGAELWVTALKEAERQPSASQGPRGTLDTNEAADDHE